MEDINTLLEDLQIARTSEPLLLSLPPKQTATAKLHGRAMEGIRQLKHRVQELLEANTRYLLRARKSEELLFKLYETHTMLCPVSEELEKEVEEHLKAPWKLSEHS